MAVTTVFFDLDGTLLPMDQEVFVKDYISRLCAYLAPHGYDPQKVSEALWIATQAAVKNDGTVGNDKRFWDAFAALLGDGVLQMESVFDDFYREEFPKVQKSVGFNPKSREVISWLKSRGIRCVLATNPVFPGVATYQRIGFAGLDKADFAYVTVFENSSFCKPDPAYYREIMAKLGLTAEECLMVGNDAHEDVAAQEAGLEVFLLTDCLINSKNADLSAIPQGDFAALQAWLEEKI